MENIIYNKVSETNRGKKQVDINRKYEFNFYIKRLIIQIYIDTLIIKHVTNIIFRYFKR